MSFLQPWILFGLPLLALPVIIHLINQFRHRTVQWGAMQFLLSAKRMNRGMARLKQILILSMRVLAVLGLIVALSRPLAGGWLGLTLGGAADTSIILLDRSASMEEQDPRTGFSKRETALRKVAELLETRGGSNRVILIENAWLDPQEIASPAKLCELPMSQPTATHADVAAMLQRAMDYLNDNVVGQADVWLITDLRSRDWTPDSGRWEGIRSLAQEAGDSMRLYVLSYPEVADQNLSVATGPVRRQAGAQGDALVTDIHLRRQGKAEAESVPLGITINGTRTVGEVDLGQPEVTLQGYAIPIDKGTQQGWGRIDLPNDSNPQDNAAYFVFGEAPPRTTVVVTNDSAVADPIIAAATAPADPGFTYLAEKLTVDRANEVPWNSASLLVWHAPIPEGILRAQLEAFVESGRVVLFLPPSIPDENEIFGMRWGAWSMHPEPNTAELSWWRPDSDILRNSLSGKALPVGSLELSRYVPVSGRFNPLARVEEQKTVMARAIMEGQTGAAYFAGMLPQRGHSNLAREGVVFYVMLHRALAIGAASQSNARLLEAGWSNPSDVVWERLAP